MADVAKPDESSRRSAGEGLYPVRAVWLRAPREPDTGNEPPQSPTNGDRDTVWIPLTPRVDEMSEPAAEATVAKPVTVAATVTTTTEPTAKPAATTNTGTEVPSAPAPAPASTPSAGPPTPAPVTSTAPTTAPPIPVPGATSPPAPARRPIQDPEVPAAASTATAVPAKTEPEQKPAVAQKSTEPERKPAVAQKATEPERKPTVEQKPAVAPTSPTVEPAADPEPHQRTEEVKIPSGTQRVSTPRTPRWTAWLPSIALVAATAVAGWVIVVKLPGWLESEPRALPSVTQSAEPTPPTASTAPQDGQRIDYRSFADPTGLTFTGVAVHAGAAVRLADGSGQSGAMWSAMTLNPARSFSTAFRFTSTGRAGTLSFVLRTQEVASAEPLDKLVPRVSVDFVVDGPAGSADTVTVTSARTGRPTTLGSANPGVDLDGGPVTVWIDYLTERQILRVYASTGTTKPTKPALTASLKLGTTLGKGPAYAGFIASTADAAGTHEMLAWHLSPPATRS